MRIGIKLWSRNIGYEKALSELIATDQVQYIELYAVPDTFKETGTFWKNFPVPFEIHAPHSAHGFNLSRPEKFDYNAGLFKETRAFADLLKVSRIIVHGGINGTTEEIIHQINRLDDPRIIIENKPFVGLMGDRCMGADLESIRNIMDSCKIGFCFDIGHAIAAANSFNIDPAKYISEFNILQPVMYHLADGNYEAEMDSHLHLGSGNYNFSKITSLFNNNSDISLETPKDSPVLLNDYIADRSFLLKLI